MMRYFKFITFLAFLIFLSSVTVGGPIIDGVKKKKKKVFLFAGQSNMDGRANADQVSEEDKKRLLNVANRIEFYYNRLPVTPLQFTDASMHVQKTFSLTQFFGPEIFFGIELAEKYPNDEFIFIKRSKGSMSLYGAWNADWDAEKAKHMNELEQPKLFSDFMEYVHSILKNYKPNEYQIMGMLWVQGEADSGVKQWGEEPANQYGENLRNLIQKTRTSLSVPTMPFVILQVGSGKVVEGMEEIAKADQDVYFIPQSQDKGSEYFYERNPLPLGHYTAVGMKRIGMKFFNVFHKIWQQE